jgi:hypothetical protein
MKNRLPFAVLSLSWLIGFISVFFISEANLKIDKKYQSYSWIQEISGPEIHQIASSLEKLSIPAFEMDWRVDWKLSIGWIPSFLSSSRVFLAPSFFQKSRALFDVKEIFIHFFHPW